MKSKKGFTLSEVLVVIVLISIIVSIAVPSIIAVNKRINARLLKGKKDILLGAAELYGKDHPDKFEGNELEVTVGTLLEQGYVKKDVDQGQNNCQVTYGCVIDPVTKQSMNEIKILLRKHKKSIISIWEGAYGISTSEDLVTLVKEKLNCTHVTKTNPCIWKDIESNPKEQPDNYLWYSGIMWRIIGVYKIDGKDVAKMISDDNIVYEVSTQS